MSCNTVPALLLPPGIGAGAPAGEHDDTVVRDADAAHHEALAREAEVGPAVEGKEQLLQEREWDRHGSKQVSGGCSTGAIYPSVRIMSNENFLPGCACTQRSASSMQKVPVSL